MADFEVITEGKINNNTTNNISFTSIPQTYQHLEVTFSWRSYATTGDVYVYARLNGKTGTEYATAGFILLDSQSSILRYTAYEDTEAFGNAGTMAASDSGAGAFSAATMMIPNYTDTSQHKLMMTRGAQGQGSTADGMTFAVCSSVSDTAAVTQLDVYPYTGHYASGTTYMLAGYKG